MLIRICLLIILIAFFTLSIYNIYFPGLQYDEVLFVNAALGGIDGSFIHRKIGQIPLLLMPYIGALKAWIYYPVFKIFPVNAMSIRIVAVIITCFALLILYRSLEKITNPFFALVCIFFQATEPCFLFMTRLDVGPNVLEFFIKVLSFSLAIRFYHRQDRNSLLLLLFILFLGVFNKLNFIWYVNCIFLIAALWFYDIYKNKKSHFKKVLPLIKAAAAGYLFIVTFVLFLVLNARKAESVTLETMNLDVKLTKIQTMVDGYVFYNYLFGWHRNFLTGTYTIIAWCIVIAGAILSLFLYSNPRHKPFALVYAGALVTALLTALQIFITREATAPWHSFMLYPFYPLLISASLYMMFINYNVLIKTGVIFLTAFILLHRIFTFSDYLEAYDKPPKNVNWSPAIYALSDYTKSQNEQFLVTDWGIHNQLLVLEQKPDKYFELWGSLYGADTDEKRNEIYNSHFTSKKFIITHDTSVLSFKEPYRELVNICNQHHLKLLPVKEIFDAHQKTFVIYKLEKSTSDCFRGARHSFSLIFNKRGSL